MQYLFLIISFILFFSESIENCSEGCGYCIEGKKCAYCKDGYFIKYDDNHQNINCESCQVNYCKICIKLFHCSDCEIGYYLENVANCKKCDPNCITCTESQNFCTSCKDGEYLSKGKCLQCDSNCKTCKTTSNNCLSCKNGYYLSPTKRCLKCPNTCTKCISENKCNSCIKNYFLYNNEECLQCNKNCKSPKDGCKCDTCYDGYYLNKNQCLECNSLCETCTQPDFCIKCINNYYKKENDPLNNGRNIKCYKDPKGYYLDNDIYKKCYQSCKKCNKGGSNSYHNCLECDINFSFEIKRNDYINCYENCNNYYYFDNRDNFHCTLDLSCPYDYPYLCEVTFECVEFDFDKISNYLLKNGLDGTESKEEEIKFYDNILKNCEKGFTSKAYNTYDIDSGIEQFLKADKLTVTLTTIKNQMNNINNNMSNIDLGECETLLRDYYHIPENENLYIKKIDIIQDGMKTVKVEFDIYAKLFKKNLINLNLTVCEKSDISISIPYKITEKLDKLNSSSSYYNDICYPTTSEYGTDMIMKDRQNEYINNDWIVCQDDCYFSGYNYNNSKAKCLCGAKKSSQSFADMYINKAKILDNFKNINNLINFKFLICYKKLFNKEGIIKNIGSYIIFSFIIFHIITIIIFELKQFSSIKKTIRKIASYKKYMSVKKNKKKGKSIKTTINPSISRNADKKKYNHKKHSHKLNKFKMKHKLKKIKENNMKFIDEEVNDFSYELSLKIDKRTYCQYYFSLLKTKHNLINVVFNKNDYNSRIIKINLFIIGLSLEYIINALFYNDDTMHKIYENKGLFNLETQLPIACYSTIISTIINYLLDYLALSNDSILNFKNDKTLINIDKRKKKLTKLLIIKFSLYFLISFLFLLFFWYYISIFGVIYKNTQIHLLKDTLMSIGLSLILPFGIYLLPGIFRIPSLSSKNNKRKCLYNFSKILQSF